MQKLRRFIFLIEICIGLWGCLQLIVGFMIVFLLFSAIPPIVLGLIGFYEYFATYGFLSSSAKPKTKVIIFIVISLILNSCIIVFPHLGIAGLDYKVPTLAQILLGFYNVFVLSPFLLKSFIVLLLFIHLLLAALDRSTKEVVKPTAVRLMQASLVLPIVLTIINVVFY